MKTIVDIILPFELTNGNDGRGSKWFRSSTIRKRVEGDLRKMGLVRDPFNFPVHVTVTRILGKGMRLWDTSSVGRGNWKEIEDALVACGWFRDDSPRWILSTRFAQDDTRRTDGPAVRVQIAVEESPEGKEGA